MTCRHYYPTTLKRSIQRAFCLLTLLTAGFTTAIARPVIDSVVPGTGIPSVTRAKIYGSGFNTTATNNVVFFGATKASITAAYADSIIVTVPIGALYMPVTVTDTSSKLTAYQRQPFLPVFDNSCYRRDSLLFESRVNFHASYQNPYVIAVGDVDGDGKPDMVVSNHAGIGSTYRIDVFLNTSTSGRINASSLNLAYSISSPTFRPTNIKLADLDRDGRLDIVVTPDNSLRIALFRNITTSAGSPNFATVAPFSVVAASGSASSAPFELGETVIGDFDRDGRPDLAVVASKWDSVIVLANNITSSLGATAAFPSTAFTSRFGFYTGSGNSAPISLVAVDMDNDGRTDIATSNLLGSTITLFRDTSTVSGSFGFTRLSSLSIPTPNYPFQIVSGDFDGDKKQDLATVGFDLATHTSNGLFVYKNNSTSGSFSFSSSFTYSTSLNDPQTLAVGDLDGDGNVDIAVANNSGNNVTMFKNTGSGSISTSSFAAFGGFAVGTSPLGITIADVDGDTKPEVIVANTGSTDTSFSILRNHPRAFVDSIYGNLNVCITSRTDTLHDSTTGGHWLSSNPYVASIDPVTGLVIPVSIGTFTATYTVSCGGDTVSTTRRIAIISTPSVSAITGPTTLCTGLTFTLSSTTTGGVWGSLSPSIATIDTTTGAATGLRAGTATITYGVTNTCGTRVVSYPVTVSNSPSPITGTTFSVCSGSSISLTSSTTGGSWFATAGTGSASASAGTVTGGAAGTAIVTYRLSSGCYDTAEVTVNPLPGGISGSSTICLGDSILLTSTSSTGVWTSSSPTVASIDSLSGDVYSRGTGTTTISYIFRSTGCLVTFAVRVNSLPANIAGVRQICENGSITITDATSGGSWSTSASGVASVGTVTGTSTVVYAGTSGTAVITYTISTTGCIDTALITVNPNPAAITGPSQVCVGDAISLGSSTVSGNWSSSAPSRGSVSATGSVVGVSAGVTTISYTLPSTGCYVTLPVTVNALPSPIAGLTTLCPGFNITATSSPLGGTWTHTNPSADNLGSLTGLITGLGAGFDTITYTTTAGCKISDTLTVHPAPPAIVGASSVCARSLVFLSDSATGGVWHSNDPSIADVDSVTGVVVGRSGGLAIITYTTPDYGCSAFLSFTVNPVLVPIIGINTSSGTTVCAGTSVTYTAIPVNGGTAPAFKWFVNRVLVGTGTTLVYTPVNGDTITARLFSNALCAQPDSVTAFVRMTVNPTIYPSVTIATANGDTVCVGSSTRFTAVPVNGGTAPTYQWKVNGVPVWTGTSWTFVPTNGDRVTVVMSSNITCRNSDTVSHTDVITVSPYIYPGVSITGSDTVCGGYPGVFTAVGTYAGFRPVYTWRVNGFVYTTGPTLAYPATTGDVIDLNMKSSWPCLLDTFANDAAGPVTVLAVNIPSVTVTAYPGYIITPGMYVTFIAHATDTGSAPTYRWFKNGVLIPGATSTVYITNVIANRDSFICKVTNGDICNGLIGYGSMVITIGDNVGVNNVAASNNDVVLAPNPNTGTFTLTGDFGTSFADGMMQMDVTNTVGQVVYSRQVSVINGRINEQVQLDNRQAAGVYFVSLRTANLTRTIRFIVN